MEPSTDDPAGPVGDRPLIKGAEVGALHHSSRNLLTPADVRWQEFPLTRFGRRGLDPEVVGRFLRRVEADLDTLYQQVIAARDEARHYRDAATELRAERWRPREPWAQRPRGEYRRPPMWPSYSPRRQGCHRQRGDGGGDG